MQTKAQKISVGFLNATAVSLVLFFGMSVMAESAMAAGQNLISNGNFEATTSAGLPLDWSKGKWGTSTVSFDYPAVGVSGSKAGKVTISQHTSGDVKWSFKKVPVTGGRVYSYTDTFSASVPSWVTAEFKMSDGSTRYHDVSHPGAQAILGALPPISFTAPLGAISVSVFHLINQIGTLTIDDASLTEDVVSPSPTASTSVNLIFNPSFEIPDAHARAAGWKRGGFGVNTPVFSYPVAGNNSAKAARVRITQYQNGDAKWYFVPPIAITGGAKYVFTDDYQSNIESKVIAEFSNNVGALLYVELSSLATSTSWKTASSTFIAPAGATKVTIFHLIRGVGSLTVDNYSLKILIPSSIVGTTPAQNSGSFGNGQAYTDGCTNPLAKNFNGLANRDNGKCIMSATSSPLITGEVMGTSTQKKELSASSSITVSNTMMNMAGTGNPTGSNPLESALSSKDQSFATRLGVGVARAQTGSVNETKSTSSLSTITKSIPNSDTMPASAGATKGDDTNWPAWTALTLFLIAIVGYGIYQAPKPTT